jgi:hypothetical protein
MTGEEQSQEYAHHFDIKGIVNKEFVLTEHKVNSAFYCDVLRLLRKNVLRHFLELRRQENWLFITTTHRLTFPSSPVNF